MFRRMPRITKALAMKVGLTAALVGVSTSVVGLGAFALFTDTQSAAPSIATGSVALAPINVSAANNRLSVGASNLAAGDTVARAVNLKNTGTIALSGIALTTSATTSSLLDSPANAMSLQLKIDKCSVAWTEAAANGGYSYTCGGTSSVVLASQAVIGSSLTLSNLSLAANADNFLVATLTLPTGADNTYQSKTSVINFAFTATQRAAQSM